MTAYQEAVKRHTDAGGRWPPGPPWPGRLKRVRCVECGHESLPLTACELCGERLNEGN